jgi:putative phosphoesterase
MIRVGLISDTHGMLRPEAIEFLRGCNHIVHAGDICDEKVLAGLRQLAPLTVVRGNNDQGAWAKELAHHTTLRLGEVEIFAIHDLKELDGASLVQGVRVVVCGHSHAPFVEQRGEILYINPGSAGPRRFKLPISVGELLIDGSHLAARTVELATSQ